MIAALVDGSVSINSLGYRERRTARAIVRDELGHRPWAESSEVRRTYWGEQLNHADTIAAIGGKSEEAGADHAELHVIEVVDDAVGVEDLVEAWLLGALNVDDGESLLSSGDVSVRARDVQIAGVFQGNKRAGDRLRLGEIGYVKHLQAFAIHHKRIAKLHGDPVRGFEKRRADFRRDFGG